MNTAVHRQTTGGYFWLSNNRRWASVIVNIAPHPFMKAHLFHTANDQDKKIGRNELIPKLASIFLQ